MPQIEVTFDIDANGILSVSAKDTKTGKQQSIQIQGSSGLEKSAIEQMVRDAESHATDDKQRRERIDAKNELDSRVYGAEKQVAEHKDKIPVAALNSIETAISAAKTALANEAAPAAELKSRSQELERALHAVSEALYKAESAKQGGAQSPPPGGASNGEQVVDADFTEEK
jgi:molecular chaperone DnaK